MREALVVEDTPSVSNLVDRLLGRRGFHCVVVGTRAEAFKVLALHPRPFAIAYVDVGLPDGTGLDVLCEIRRSTPKLPVILATGCVAGVERGSGATFVLSKPFALTTFDEAVDACLARDDEALLGCGPSAGPQVAATR